MKAVPLDHRTAVSAEIRALMGRHRVSQTELARVCGMSQSSLSARLSGSVAWDIDDLKAIADYFQVPAPIILVMTNCTDVVQLSLLDSESMRPRPEDCQVLALAV